MYLQADVCRAELLVEVEAAYLNQSALCSDVISQ
jgi:hypothetical protein